MLTPYYSTLQAVKVSKGKKALLAYSVEGLIDVDTFETRPSLISLVQLQRSLARGVHPAFSLLLRSDLPFCCE